jgi:hypothetical protein
MYVITYYNLQRQECNTFDDAQGRSGHTANVEEYLSVEIDPGVQGWPNVITLVGHL